jgi:hypothetical protein
MTSDSHHRGQIPRRVPRRQYEMVPPFQFLLPSGKAARLYRRVSPSAPLATNLCCCRPKSVIAFQGEGQTGGSSPALRWPMFPQ